MTAALVLLAVALVLALAALAVQRGRLNRALAAAREAQQALAARESGIALFRDALEALPDGVVVLDQHRRIEWLNERAQACLDISPNCDIGTPLNHLLREPDFVAFLAAAEPGSSLALRTRRYPNQLLHVQIAPLAPERLLLLVRDITQLDRVASMRRDFVANVSHELKTPLTVALGFIETAQDALADTPPEEVARYLQTASEQAERMRRLIDDLLTLSRLENGAPPPREETVALDALLTEIHGEAVALSAGRHDIRLSVGRTPRLRGSSRELHSALMNLASNAVRYTPDGGRIDLTWRDLPNGGGEFCVADTGIGIPVEHIGRLTERFYRVDRGRSRDSGGTGLGLAIVKHVLERHGGALAITSEPGKGSTFCAGFPPVRIVR